jgi:hypothetical protein
MALDPMSADDPARHNPPRIYVEFSVKPYLDQEKSKEAGHNVYVDRDWMKWTKKGAQGLSNEDWLDRAQQHHPGVWGAAKDAYRFWKEGVEAPIVGTDLKMWPMITPAQVLNFHALGVKSVEDLAAITDGDIQRLPSGTRALRDKAKAWLESANEHGRSAEVINALRSDLEQTKDALADAMAAVKEQREQINRLMEQSRNGDPSIQSAGSSLDSERPKKRGRPPKRDSNSDTSED